MKSAWALTPLFLLLGVIVIAALVLTRSPEHPAVSPGDLGRAAPAFTLARVGGGAPVTSADFAGRPHLVNFYASWCTPCRAEHPQLMALKRRGAIILGIAYKDRPDATQAFLNQLGNPFAAAALDPDGRFALEMGVAGAVPESFLIDAQGRIVEVFRGPLTEDIVAREIAPVLLRN